MIKSSFLNQIKSIITQILELKAGQNFGSMYLMIRAYNNREMDKKS